MIIKSKTSTHPSRTTCLVAGRNAEQILRDGSKVTSGRII